LRTAASAKSLTCVSSCDSASTNESSPASYLGDEAYASYRRRVPMLLPFAKIAPGASAGQRGGD
jgi:hypothetical protein